MTAVVILSRCATHLIPCAQAVRACEPAMPVVVVDDGARADAEPYLGGIVWVAGVQPFCFARNANLGIAAAGTDDVILLNDDALLETPGGFTAMQQVADTGGLGLCSAAIQGFVCNPRQRWHYPPRLRIEPEMLAFVAVYIPRYTLDMVGGLDERFVGYGYEDNDYCRRVLAAGLYLAVYDPCIVNHPPDASSYRSAPDWQARYAQNRAIYQEKWRQEPDG